MAGRVAGKIKLQSVDELLGVPEIAGTQEIEIGRIHSFPNHPFKVLDDDKMESLVDSIRENGILSRLILKNFSNYCRRKDMRLSAVSIRQSVEKSKSGLSGSALWEKIFLRSI